MTTNIPLMAVLGALVAFSTYTLFVRHGPVYKLLQLTHLPHEFNLELLLLIIANAALSYGWEAYGAAAFADFVGRTTRRYRRWRGTARRPTSKAYRAIERELEDDD